MKNTIINTLILVLSLLFIFSAFEIGTRILYKEYRFTNFLGEEGAFLRNRSPAEYHSKLGWIPKIGTFVESKTMITILEDGIRANGKKAVITLNELILAIGDSFTFGGNMSDSETWPSILEELSGTRVINGGVFGYGIDQSFLRMKMLAKKYKPNIIIFSFIPDDISRCELSNRLAKKPYFDVLDGKLILNDKYVSSYKPAARIQSRYKRRLGYSFFIHKLMMERLKGYWLQDVNNQIKKIHSKGEEVVCLIFDEIKKYAVNNGIKVYILVQYFERNFESPDCCRRELERTINVIKCIDKPLQLVDLYNSTVELRKQDKGKYKSLYKGHMTKEGNYFVAQILNEVMNQSP